MARQKGSANFAGTLEVLAGGPLDARTRVPAKTDLTASGQFPYPYVGLECYVVAENKKYRLIADDPTDLDNWEEVGSGGTGLPSGGTQGQVLTKQSSTEGDADWDDIPHDNTKANSASLAPVETTTTSEHAYEVGDHLMLAGQRYIVTSDIAVGDTLDVSTNIQAVNLEDETGLSEADFADIITPLPGEALDGVIISPEERRVGWYYNMNGDGTKKPIYQKTIDVGYLPNTSTKGVPIDVSSIDKIIMATGFTYTNNNTLRQIPHVYGTTANSIQYLIGMWFQLLDGVWTAYVVSNYNNSLSEYAYITIQYTKSIDTYA